ncbi:intraflagellar transport protein 27 homolog isoform X2 [Eucyclogobius newberryi]|uniref:intraflagellar transport protein 27 homolog isoform X2 n=1 Tax=Eucyclogobius newberryi TaxID=166745 RepID=UPI003B5BE505
MVKLRTRCLLVGDAAVGKSALCHMFHSEDVQFQRSYNMELYLVDCPGKELLAEACEKMWGEAWLLCLVFDLSNEQSFLSCPRWLEKVQTHSLGRSVSGVLVGNKSDLLERRAVQSKDAQDWAQNNGLDYYETSAKELDTCMAPLLSLAQICKSLFEESCEKTQSLAK